MAERAKNWRRSKEIVFMETQDSTGKYEFKILDQEGDENGVNPVFLVGKQGILPKEQTLPLTHHLMVAFFCCPAQTSRKCQKLMSPPAEPGVYPREILLALLPIEWVKREPKIFIRTGPGGAFRPRQDSIGGNHPGFQSGRSGSAGHLFPTPWRKTGPRVKSGQPKFVPTRTDGRTTAS
jgi:hypothetical protein